MRKESNGVALKDRQSGTVRDAYQADGLAKDPRECLKDVHRWSEAGYQPPIAIAIFLKSLLSFLEQFKDGLGRI